MLHYETFHNFSRLHLCLAETLVCLPRVEWERFLAGSLALIAENEQPSGDAFNGLHDSVSSDRARARDSEGMSSEGIQPGEVVSSGDFHGFVSFERARALDSEGMSSEGIQPGDDVPMGEASLLQPSYDLETSEETVVQIVQLAELLVHNQQTLGDLEALFMITEEPLSVAMLAESLHSEPAIIADLCSYLQTKYRMQRYGFSLRYIAGGYRMWSSVKHASAVEAHIVRSKSGKLSRAMTETLAIIAFKQPITRTQIGAIRGVDADVAVRSLLSRGLIEEQGRNDDPGRPMTYGTSQYFLERMGITSLDALPALDSFAPAGTPPPEPAIAEYKTARRLVDMMDDPKEETLAFQAAMAKADLAVESLNANLDFDANFNSTAQSSAQEQTQTEEQSQAKEQAQTEEQSQTEEQAQSEDDTLLTDGNSGEERGEPLLEDLEFDDVVDLELDEE